MAALYGMHEADPIPGVQLIYPLDVIDITIEYQRAGALLLSTWNV